MSGEAPSAPISSETAAEAILDLLDQDGPELLLSLKATAQLLDDVDN
jgi:hypothetical protein